jgi:hypothetical protein
MALSFNNCLIQAADGVNYMYGDCCCDISCTVTVTENITIDSLTSFFSMESFYFSSDPKIYIDGNLQTFPLSLNSGDTFDMTMSICASSAGNTDDLQLKFTIASFGSEWFYFDFEAIDLSSTISPSSFAFGNTVIDSTKTLGFQLQNPALCCYQYTLTTDCPDLVITPDVSNTLCTGDKQSNFKLDWTPVAIGALSCNLTITTDCQTIDIPITGNAINAPSGGGERVEQKNKVDQTTRVEACSPRTANNRCDTAKSMQNAIRTNARRFGKR